MEHFSYKSGYSVRGRTHIEAFKEELAWAIDKWLQEVISNKILFELCSYTTKKLKNKAVLKLKQYCMRCYVYEDVYPIFKGRGICKNHC